MDYKLEVKLKRGFLVKREITAVNLGIMLYPNLS